MRVNHLFVAAIISRMVSLTPEGAIASGAPLGAFWLLPLAVLSQSEV
jgi:hypothetical protein